MMISKFLLNARGISTFSDNLLTYLSFKHAWKGPLFVNWDITYRCNSRCVFCERWKRKNEDIPLKEKLKIVKRLGESGVWLLSLCGGEPLLTSNLEKILKSVKKYGMKINISTNGLLLKDLPERVIKLVDFFTISVHSHKEKIHDELVGTPGSFKRIREGIKRIRNLGNRRPIIFVRCVVNKKNFSQIEAFLKVWRPLSDEIIFQPAVENQKMMFTLPKDVKISKDDIRHIKKYFSSLKRYDSFSLQNLFVPEYLFKRDRLKKRLYCFSCFFFLTLDEEGNVYPCSERIFKLGNLREKSLIDILNSKIALKFKNTLRRGENKCVCVHSGSMLNAYLSNFLKYWRWID